MNKVVKLRPASGTSALRAAAPVRPEDSLRAAAEALDQVLAAAHEAGDWRAVRVLHSVTALLSATRP